MLISYQTKQAISEGISHPSSALVPPLVFPLGGDVGAGLLLSRAAPWLGWHILGYSHILGCFHTLGLSVDVVGCPAHLQV